MYPNIETIVVDNSSSDGTVEMIEKEFPSVRLIKLDENLLNLVPLDRYEVLLQSGFNCELIRYDKAVHSPEKMASYEKLNLFARSRIHD